MSRLVDVTGKDIAAFIASNKVKRDDVLVRKTNTSLLYWLHGSSYGKHENLIIPAAATERHENALAYFFDVINAVEYVDIRIYPWCSTAKKYFGQIDERVTLLTLVFTKLAFSRVYVRYGDDNISSIDADVGSCWKQQNFDGVSAAITNQIESELEPQTTLLFIANTTMNLESIHSPRAVSYIESEPIDAGKRIVVEKKNVNRYFSFSIDVKVYRMHCQWKKRHEMVQKIHAVAELNGGAILHYDFSGPDRFVMKLQSSHYKMHSTSLPSARSVQNYIVNLAMVLCELFEPYVVLWIISWLPSVSLMLRYKKVAILENVKRYICRRDANRNSVAMHTRSRSKKQQ